MLCAIREVSSRTILIARAGRTLPDYTNLRFPYSGIEQLPPVRLPQIQMPLSIRTAPKQLLRIAELRPERAPHLVSHRIAACSNRGPHRRNQVLGARAVLCLN